MSGEKLSGGCVCGAIRYELDNTPAFVAHCHCRDCQRSSGAPMATVIAVPRSAFRKIKGETASYRYTGDSGNPVVRHFCPGCGAPLFSDVAVMPDLWFVRVPSLDTPDVVAPGMHVYCDSAQPWDISGDELPRFGKLPG
ncbi:MAG: aldehyde-activating protein [Rhodocyclaceae bacterium]|nr:MAG: aldehyde-activating protein [Rhodocyclaceae bacterium]